MPVVNSVRASSVDGRIAAGTLGTGFATGAAAESVAARGWRRCGLSLCGRGALGRLLRLDALLLWGRLDALRLRGGCRMGALLITLDIFAAF
jgi:hypothetical protein